MVGTGGHRLRASLQSAPNTALIDPFTILLTALATLGAMRSSRLPLALAALLLSAPLIPPVHADAQDRGADHARDSVRSGDYVRLEQLLADAEKRFPGRVIEVELDQDDDEYEIEILMRDGRVVELKYDARSGRLLKVEIDD